LLSVVLAPLMAAFWAIGQRHRAGNRESGPDRLSNLLHKERLLGAVESEAAHALSNMLES
jgi:hypothetical protein